MASIASIPEQLNGLQLSKAEDASVRLFIPKLAEHPELRKIVSDLGLNIRGVHFEHADFFAGLFDFSFKQTFGCSDFETMNEFATALEKLVEMEESA
ncbi:hypothetical protein L596_001338 [Steinernema carpocapsae]|uniref:arginine kinase n=1 Tax=Steinernema carpocapsae TaxID=34508 RepID=A0A4U8UL95_STECR|nr:hypothetical protein L596_001338 [Steinernema carpocapsae]